jgi:hypothetical protein
VPGGRRTGISAAIHADRSLETYPSCFFWQVPGRPPLIPSSPLGNCTTISLSGLARSAFNSALCAAFPAVGMNANTFDIGPARARYGPQSASGHRRQRLSSAIALLHFRYGLALREHKGRQRRGSPSESSRRAFGSSWPLWRGPIQSEFSNIYVPTLS